MRRRRRLRIDRTSGSKGLPFISKSARNPTPAAWPVSVRPEPLPEPFEYSGPECDVIRPILFAFALQSSWPLLPEE